MGRQSNMKWKKRIARYLQALRTQRPRLWALFSGHPKFKVTK